MRRILVCLLAATFGTLGSLHADETVRAVQTRLKTGGYYFGEITGRYDSSTAAAVTRYQIRNGLKITGTLDPQTNYALGVSETKPEMPSPRFGEDVWRYLRKSDQEQIKRMMAEDARPSQAKTKSSVAVGPTGPVPSPSAPDAARPPATTDAPSSAYDRERLQDYIAAFILAGLDPQVGAETEFFAEAVNYFGKPGVTREAIRHDLQRYNARWPQRSFSLAGELEIKAVNNDDLKVSFPLRYNLRNGSRHSSGKVLKTLVLKKTGNDDLEIIGVDEHKTE